MKTKVRIPYKMLGAMALTGTILLLAICAPAQHIAPAQNLFEADFDSGIIYEFTPDGNQSIFASGLAPTALAFNSAGDLFESDAYGYIYEFRNKHGTLSSNAVVFASGLAPIALAFNSAGDLFESDAYGYIYEFRNKHGTLSSNAVVFASVPDISQGLALNRAGDLFVSEFNDSIGPGHIYEFTPGGVESTFASPGFFDGDALAFNSAGNLFVSDPFSEGIYVFTPDGNQSVFASGFLNPHKLAFNSAGDLFVSDPSSGTIYEFTPDGTGFVFASGLVLLEPEALAFAPSSAQSQSVYVGNPALPFVYVISAQPDGVPPLVIMGEYSPAGPLPTTTQPLPNGMVQDVKFYGQDYDFTLYALSRDENCSDTNEQTFRVVAAQHFSGTNPAPGTITLPVSDFRVRAGDFLAFAGIGPWYPQQPNDAPNTDATYEDSTQPIGYDNDTATPPVLGEKFTIGLNRDPNATYDYIDDNFGNQGRIYAIGVDVLKDESHRDRHEPFHDE